MRSIWVENHIGYVIDFSLQKKKKNVTDFSFSFVWLTYDINTRLKKFSFYLFNFKYLLVLDFNMGTNCLWF